MATTVGGNHGKCATFPRNKSYWMMEGFSGLGTIFLKSPMMLRHPCWSRWVHTFYLAVLSAVACGMSWLMPEVETPSCRKIRKIVIRLKKPRQVMTSTFGLQQLQNSTPHHILKLPFTWMQTSRPHFQNPTFTSTVSGTRKWIKSAEACNFYPLVTKESQNHHHHKWTAFELCIVPNHHDALPLV